MAETVHALEIILNDGMSFLTNQYDSISSLRQAIDSNEVISCYWMRVDGTRFEEDIWFSMDFIRQIRTNRS